MLWSLIPDVAEQLPGSLTWVVYCCLLCTLCLCKAEIITLWIWQLNYASASLSSHLWFVVFWGFFLTQSLWQNRSRQRLLQYKLTCSSCLLRGAISTWGWAITPQPSICGMRAPSLAEFIKGRANWNSSMYPSRYAKLWHAHITV